MAKQAESTNQPAGGESTPEPTLESNTPNAVPNAQPAPKAPVVPTVQEVYFGTEGQSKQDAPPAEKSEAAQPQAKLFTQDEVNALIGNTRKEVRAQFKDYDELKSKVQEQEAAAQSEEEKRATRLQDLERQAETLAAENRSLKVNQSIMAAAVEAGLPPQAAVKLVDMAAAELDDAGAIKNAGALVQAVAEQFPGLVKTATPAPRAGAASNPGRETQPAGRTDADRQREYFGAGGGGFWTGGGVRTHESN